MVVADMAARCTHEHKMTTGFVTHRAGEALVVEEVLPHGWVQKPSNNID